MVGSDLKSRADSLFAVQVGARCAARATTTAAAVIILLVVVVLYYILALLGYCIFYMVVGA